MKKEPFQVSVNSHYQFDLQPEEAKSLDIVAENDHLYHLLHQGKAYKIELLETDYSNRTYVLRIDGTKYTVNINDYYSRLIQQLGLHSNSSHKMNTVKAPMPGLVLSVLVEPGQTVQKGDALVILEAMKMENVIKAGGDGVVKAINAQKGQPVDKGHTLLEFA